MTPRMSSVCAGSAQDWKTIRQAYLKISEIRRSLGLGVPVPSALAPDAEFLQRWNQLLPTAAAIALDLWDTTLVRACLAPDDRFLFLKELAPFASLAYSREEIYTLRLQAEQHARESRRQQSGFTEVTLHEIYTRLGQEITLTPEQITACIEAEQTLELCLAKPNLPILQLIQAAQAEGKTILLAVDTPLDKHFVHKLLSHSGYAIEPSHIFTSAEHRLNLNTGSLLRKAAKNFALSSHQVLALTGDLVLESPLARQTEFTLLTHPYTPAPEAARPRRALNLQPIGSLLHGTARQLPLTLPANANPFWFQIGARTLGPLLASFLLWLTNQWLQHRIQHVYFLGRPGHLLRDLYEILREAHPDLPPSQHLHASRRAYLLPALDCLHAPEIGALLHRQNPTPIGDLLAPFEVNPAHYTEAFRKAGFHSLATPIDPGHNPIRLQRLFRDPEILSALNEQAQSERANLLCYLKQQLFITDRPAALVDLGGNTTTTRSLLSILQHEEIRHHLSSYHLLTLDGAQSPHYPHYHYHSYLAHNGEPHALSTPFAGGRSLLHALCSAHQPLVKYFTSVEAKIEPVSTPTPHTPEDRAHFCSLHEGILAYARNLFANPLHRLLLTEIPPEIAAEDMIVLMTRPTLEEATQIGALPDLDGSKNPQPLAALPIEGNESLTPEQLLNLYHRTAWKSGLLHGETEPSWLLRQLIA